MKQYEVISLLVLYSIFGLLLLLMGIPSFYLGIVEGIIIGAFYLLGVTVPLYFFIRFVMKRTVISFKFFIVASVPMVTFIGIMIILMVQLGKALEHF